MAQPIVVSSDAAYATKRNIMFPGTQAQATAAEARAQSRINDAMTGTGVTVTVGAGSIKVAT